MPARANLSGCLRSCCWSKEPLFGEAACFSWRSHHSSPSTQRNADSLPFIIPHSKSSQGPRFPLPYSFFTRFAALWLLPIRCVAATTLERGRGSSPYYDLGSIQALN